MQHQVRVYGPDLNSTGVDATLHIDGVTARIDELGLLVQLQQVRLRRIGFSSSGLEIAWHDERGAWAVHVLDPPRARGLLTELHAMVPGAYAEFVGQRRGFARKARLTWGVLGVLLLLPIAVVLAFLWLLDPLTTWAVNHVSLEQERQLGEQSFRGIATRLKLRDDADAARVVRSLGQRITQGSRYRYEFHVAEDPSVNAFALPGGIVVVNTGLINATRRPEELAGVLAHESEHVELRHGLRQIAKQLGVSATLALLMGDVGASLGGRIAEELLSLRFTRASEQQADEKAVSLLVHASIDPTGLRDFFGRLANEPAPPTLLSSHPTSAERQQLLASLIRLQPSTRSVPLDFGPWPPPFLGGTP